jgi:hypothetical protein
MLSICEIVERKDIVALRRKVITSDQLAVALAIPPIDGLP